MTIRKDKKFRYQSWAENPNISKEEVDKAFYKLAKPKKGVVVVEHHTVKKPTIAAVAQDFIDSAKPATTSPDSMTELTNSIIRRKANKAKRLENFADVVIRDATQKFERDHTGLPSILLAEASNKPPTLDDYIRLGLSLAQLSDEERKNIQWMLDRSMPEEK